MFILTKRTSGPRGFYDVYFEKSFLGMGRRITQTVMNIMGAKKFDTKKEATEFARFYLNGNWKVKPLK